jgi:S1-C subfamily serine protease
MQPIYALSGDIPDPLVRVSPVMQRRWRQPPQCVGSSFYVGKFGKSALFVTARHVLRDIEGKPAEAFILLPTFSPKAQKEPDGMATLSILKTCGSDPFSDAAILVTEIPSELPPQPFIDTDCPKAGEMCAALGYSEMTTTATRDLGWKDTGPKLEFNFRACRGFVAEIFPRRRDASMVKFPSFQFDATDRPGMSGGPVVNGDGSIIGIVSSGYDTGPSYATLIAMIAELKVDIMRENDRDEEVLVADLIQTGIIYNKARLNFSINGRDESTLVTWRESSD